MTEQKERRQQNIVKNSNSEKQGGFTDSFGKIAVLFLPYGLKLFHLPKAGSKIGFVLLLHGVMVQVKKKKKKKRATGKGKVLREFFLVPWSWKTQDGLGSFAHSFAIPSSHVERPSFPYWLLVTMRRSLENHWEFIYVFPKLAFNDGVNMHINGYRGHAKHSKNT